MRAFRTLAALGLAGMAASGCSYAERRWHDLEDAGSVSPGLGIEGSFKLGEFVHAGIGGSVSTETAPVLCPIPGLYQLIYGRMPTTTELWPPISIFFADKFDIPAAAHSIKWDVIYPYGPLPKDETRLLKPELEEWVGVPPQHRCFFLIPVGFNRDEVPTHPGHWFDFEVTLILGVGAKLRLRPIEFVDFLFGFIPLVDIMGDDLLPPRAPLGPYWYKTPAPDPEHPRSTVNFPDVPVGYPPR